MLHPRFASITAVGVMAALCATSIPCSAAAVEFLTGVGEQRVIMLSDGAEVQLNTASALHVDRGDAREIAFVADEAQVDTQRNLRGGIGDAREIELVAGEALFDLRAVSGAVDPSAVNAERAATAFRLHSGPVSVREASGRFLVSRHSDRTSILVIEGEVVVDNARRRAWRDSLRLHAAEELAIRETQGSVSVRKLDKARVTLRLAWIEGRIWFEHEPLGAVIARINRYNVQQLEIVDPRIAKRPLTGLLCPTALDQLVRRFETLGVRVVPSGDIDPNARVIRLAGDDR